MNLEGQTLQPPNWQKEKFTKFKQVQLSPLFHFLNVRIYGFFSKRIHISIFLHFLQRYTRY